VVTQSSTSTQTLVVDVKPEAGATSSPASIAFSLTPETRIKTPGAPSQANVAGTLDVGARVAVLGEKQADGSWKAVQVLVKPTAPVASPVTGSVVSIENGILTLVLPNGKTKTIEVGSDMPAPGEGEIVTVFAQGASGGDRPPKATGLVRAAEVHDRLKKFLDGVEATTGQSPAVKKHRDEVAARVADLLERHAEHRVQILKGLQGREGLPEKARAGISRALENAEKNQTEARSKSQDTRGRLGLPKEGANGKADRTPPPGRPGQAGGK
jgi:hypothetical protein